MHIYEKRVQFDSAVLLCDSRHIFIWKAKQKKYKRLQHFIWDAAALFATAVKRIAISVHFHFDFISHKINARFKDSRMRIRMAECKLHTLYRQATWRAWASYGFVNVYVCDAYVQLKRKQSFVCIRWRFNQNDSSWDKVSWHWIFKGDGKLFYRLDEVIANLI